MIKIAALIWIMLATTLAGIALLVVVTVPQFSQDAQFLIPVACGGAMIVAMPLSYAIARNIAKAKAA